MNDTNKLKNKQISKLYHECKVEIINHELVARSPLTKEQESNIDINKEYAIIPLEDKEEAITIKKLTSIVLNLVDKIDTMQE